MNWYAASLILAALGQVTLSAPLEVVEHEPVEIRSAVVIPEGAQALHDWEVSGAAKGREYADGQVFAVWAPPGKYEIEHEVFLIDWDAKQVRKVEEVHLLIVSPRAPPDPPEPGPGPEPDPEPNPDIPEDEYGNIGRKAAQWGIELKLDKMESIGSNYLRAGRRLSAEETPVFATIDQATRYVSKENEAVKTQSRNWSEWHQRIQAPWRQYVVDRSTAAGFLQAVGVGLKRAD